ncbi:2429_t:CDS:2 [Ambispora gerdemannii]|uniref:2429_t:CDS:1 n=1 Tax=Ambispora gerdemannii TaxID=144530 RepID=A0A9N9AJT6_9GLOM|nr:2429_t:CDS:2 [Ambispora gerdemannii]
MSGVPVLIETIREEVEKLRSKLTSAGTSSNNPTKSESPNKVEDEENLDLMRDLRIATSPIAVENVTALRMINWRIKPSNNNTTNQITRERDKLQADDNEGSEDSISQSLALVIPKATRAEKHVTKPISVLELLRGGERFEKNEKLPIQRLEIEYIMKLCHLG